MLRLEPARLGAHLEHTDIRGVVDKEPHRAQRLERVRDPAVVLLADRAAHQTVTVDLRFGREQTEEERFLRHLEAEEADGEIALGRDVLRNIEDEARLPHRRSSGDDDEVAGLQAARYLVEVCKAGWDARNQAFLLEQLLDLREALLDQVAHRHEAGLQPIVGHGKDRALSLVEDQVGLLVRLVRIGDDLVRCINEVSQRRLLLDDPCVVLDVGGARHTVRERGDVGRPANFIDFTGTREFLLHRDEVDRLPALAERNHLVENAPVRVAVKISRGEDLRGEIEGVVVNQDRTEHGTLGFEIVRKRALRSGNDCFGHERRSR
jgi:hypothetical protein